jgi:hypothetical protein
MCVGQQLYFLLFHKARSALKCAAPQSRSAADGFFAGVSFDFVADLRLKFVATAWKSVRAAKSGRSQSIRFFSLSETSQDEEIRISAAQKVVSQQSKSRQQNKIQPETKKQQSKPSTWCNNCRHQSNFEDF